jgi:TolB-like protein
MPFLLENGRMDRVGSAESILFEGFRLDRRVGCLFRLDREGAGTPVALGSRGLDLLGLLVDRQGELVLKDAILKAVWPGRVVEEANLNVQISKLRHILDQNRDQGSCIQTVPGRGYCFVAPVTRPDAEARPVIPAISEGGALPRQRLSIVVLPFANLSEDRQQQYFADGITDDLTTDLSRIEGMFVISRNTAFTYRKHSVDTKQIGRELGVRYVLEGSVRRLASRVRFNAQLIDAETDTHLWADRFDCDTGDLFALQNEITSRISVALNLEMVAAEALRPTEHPDALDYIFRGRALAWGRPPSAEGYTEAIGLFERALELDPHSVIAQSWLAAVLATRVLDNVSSSAAADIARAKRLIEHGLAAAPCRPLGHYAKGQVSRAQNRFEEAIFEYETVLASDRNWVGAIAALAWCKFFVGSIEETIPLVEQAMCLSPRDPYIGNWYYRIGVVHLLQSRIDEATVWLERARNAAPENPLHHAYLASTYALKGEPERAAAELAGAQRLNRDGRYTSIARLRALGHFGVPAIRFLYESIYFVGLRKAGMPEE